MRKTIFVKPLSWRIGLVCLIALVITHLPGLAQNATPAATVAKDAPAATMPSDPKELILLAAKINGLTGDDMKPWHLKASYTLYDDNGKESDRGTFEESWAGEKLDKQVLTLGEATWTETIDSHGAFETDRKTLPAALESKISLLSSFRTPFLSSIRTQFVSPLPAESELRKFEFTSKDLQSGTLKLKCVRANYLPQTMPLDFFNEFFCMSPEFQSLRIVVSSDFRDQVLRNDPKPFEGRSITHELQFLRNGKPRMKASLEILEDIGAVRMEDFTPRPGSVPAQNSITIAPGIMTGMLLKGVQPEYPLYAKSAGIQGTVILQAKISKAGHIEDLHVISGPAEFQQASLDAVKKWVYRPYLLNGEPVEVMTTINVIFALGNTPFRK